MVYNIGKNSHLFMRGRVALYSILKALKIGRGDEVIMQAFTCLAVPSPVMLLGAKPIYVDIDPAGYNIDITSLESRITSKTRAIIIQHTFGIPADIRGVVEIAEKHGLFVIEDCCHAVGSLYEGIEVGTFGDAAFYSTEWAKPFNTGIGGVLVVNDTRYKKNIEDQYSRLVAPPLKDIVMLRSQYLLHETLLRPAFYWRIRDIYRFFSKKGMIIGTFSREELESKKPEYFNYRMSNWQARLLNDKMLEMEKYVAGKKNLKKQYDDLLSRMGMPALNVSDRADPVLLRYPMMVEDKEEFLTRAKAKRIEMGNWFTSPVHPKEEREWGDVGYDKSSCPEAERKARCCVNLPMHSKIKEKELNAIFEFIAQNRESVTGYC